MLMLDPRQLFHIHPLMCRWTEKRSVEQVVSKGEV